MDLNFTAHTTQQGLVNRYAPDLGSWKFSRFDHVGNHPVSHTLHRLLAQPAPLGNAARLGRPVFGIISVGEQRFAR